MATINAQVRLGSNSVSPNPSFPGNQFNYTQVGTAYVSGLVTCTTTAISIPMGAITQPRWCAFQNQSTTVDAIASPDGTNYNWSIPVGSCVLNASVTSAVGISIKTTSGTADVVYTIMQG
mgnify:CR=1 FL=1